MEEERLQRINLKLSEGRFRNGREETAMSYSLPMQVPLSMEPLLRRASKRLQETINTYRDRYGSNDSIPQGGVVAMAAIEVAYRLEIAEDKASKSGLLERLEAMNALAEELLIGENPSSSKPS